LRATARAALTALAAIALLGVAAVAPARAEVKVILKDGRTFVLPLRGDQVDRIIVDGRVLGGPRRGGLPGAVGTPPAGNKRQGKRDPLADRNLPSRGAEASPSISALPSGAGRLIRVGPEREIQLPSQASKIARDGDVIEIDAAEYFGDVAVWHANNLTIRGVGGRPLLDAAGNTAQGKAIWVTNGANITIENVELANAKVKARNGAGIRAQGPNLTVRGVVFRHDQDGILAVADPDSRVTIEFSEFAGNGAGDGRSHGLYINKMAELRFVGNYLHGTKVGHHLKTGAARNIILNNAFIDGDTGTSSYAIDMYAARQAIILGNVFHQGARTENTALIHLAAKVASAGAYAYIGHNSAIGDRVKGIFLLNQSPIPAKVYNNIWVGSLKPAKGRAELSHNVVAPISVFRDPANLDFRLVDGAVAIGKGVQLGRIDGIALNPEWEYVHPLGRRPRPKEGVPDAGAYEFQPRS